MSKPRIYMGGPIRHSDDNGSAWRSEVEAAYGHAYTFLNPLDWASPDEHGNAPTGVVQEDLARLETADAVLVRWRTDIPSRGTSMEIAYASQWDIPVVLWCADAPTRPTGWLETNVSQWVLSHADTVTVDRTAAFEALNTILGGSVGEEGGAATA